MPMHWLPWKLGGPTSKWQGDKCLYWLLWRLCDVQRMLVPAMTILADGCYCNRTMSDE